MAKTPSRKSLCAGKHSQDTKKRLVIQALLLSKRPISRRQLSAATGLEISTLCQPLFDLVYKHGSVKIAFYANCVTTGVSVMHFALIDKKGAKNE